ncbi:hypothetical protein RND81_08G167800 [Saponaria officinalis]|uniref:KIB1-4 beta-propeller domain-containing protein n=1 Tax=Saponaria officinalis TaxID=3572 RepID=A0AAW1J8J3_SAPOF
MPYYSPKIKSYVKKIAQFDGKFIIASLSGWFVLRERENLAAYSLWNPITLQSIHLPELLDAPHEHPQCVFTSAPHDNNTSNIKMDCVFLMFFKGLVFFCKPTTRDGTSWVKHILQHNGTDMEIISAASVNGDIYAIDLTKGYNFVRIKITSDVSHPLLLEPSFLEVPYFRVFNVYKASVVRLVEVDGILYYVYILARQQDDLSNFDIFMTFVWEMDLSRMGWIRVRSLGDKSLLLSCGGSTWCWAGISRGGLIERDCIYLVQDGCQTVHLYRLRDNSYTYLLPRNNFRWVVNGPFWFMPEHKRLV